MGLRDILRDIDFKDIAMAMAVASHGDNVVPTVVTMLEQQRKEQEAKQKEANTVNLLTGLFREMGKYEDPAINLLRQRAEIEALPDEVEAYSTKNVPSSVSGQPGSAEAGWNAFSGGGVTTETVANPEKAKKNADFILSVYKTKESLPNIADAIASLMPQIKDKDIDPQLVLSALSTIYNKREAQVAKLLDIAAKHIEAEEARKAKSQEIVSFPADHTIITRGGKIISQGKEKPEGEIEKTLRSIYGDAVRGWSPQEKLERWAEIQKVKEAKRELVGYDPKGNPVFVDKWTGQQTVILPDGSERVYRGKKLPKEERPQNEKSPTTVSELKRLYEAGEISKEAYFNALMKWPFWLNYPGGYDQSPTNNVADKRPLETPTQSKPGTLVIPPDTGGGAKTPPKPLSGILKGNKLIVGDKEYNVVNGSVVIDGYVWDVKQLKKGSQ